MYSLDNYITVRFLSVTSLILSYYLYLNTYVLIPCDSAFYALFHTLHNSSMKILLSSFDRVQEMESLNLESRMLDTVMIISSLPILFCFLFGRLFFVVCVVSFLHCIKFWKQNRKISIIPKCGNLLWGFRNVYLLKNLIRPII